MLTAITRGVGPKLAKCELSFLKRERIDIARAVEEHRQYEACLESLGVRVIALPDDPAFPDGVFVEDPAIVLDEIAVITRMGAVSRRGEADAIVTALAPFRRTVHLREPATLEGGDVMVAGKTLYVGLSQRTNRNGISQLAHVLGAFDYDVVPVEIHGCLHFKSACCYLGASPQGDDSVLANREWFDATPLAGLRVLEVPAEEAWAANVLRVGDVVLVPSRFPRTGEMLTSAGYRVVTVDNTELAKAESGLTCMSLLFEA